MDDSDSKRIGRSLLRLEGAASFAAAHHEPALGLALEVDGVGRCEFPLSPERIRAMIERAVPSPFGYRSETIRDPSVRDSWEILAAHVHIDERLWSIRFGRGLHKIVEALGLAPEAEVTATLQKLLIYEQGQFFAPHRDSEKSPTMVGTLVIVLPSSYRGGEVVVSHAGKTVALSTAQAGGTNHVSFLGFYGDCVHETKPVEAGYRVALSYSLDAGPTASACPPDDDFVDLRERLDAFFYDPHDEDDVLHPWLVYLLDHQYSEQSIDWSRLKNADKIRAQALQHVADALDCDCFLALADVHESYTIDENEEEEEGDDDVLDPDAVEADEGADPDAAPFVVVPDRDDPIEELSFDGTAAAPSGAEISTSGTLTERDLTLTHWVDGQGEPRAGTNEAVDDDCIVTTVESHGRSTYETSLEPWTGNEGGSAQKWYHQAALVIVPRRSPLHEEIVGVPEPEAGVDDRAAGARGAETVRVRRRRARPT